MQLRGFVHRAGHEPYLVTRYEEGGSLADHVARVGALPAEVATAILGQVLRALDVAHHAGVVHRDLKPDNVLLSRAVGPGEVPHCRVGDFGIAATPGGLGAFPSPTRGARFVGTPEYAAPEQFAAAQDRPQEAPSPATDVFAAGGLLVFMLTGEPPVALSDRNDPARAAEELRGQLPPQLAGRGLALDEQALDRLQGLVTHMMALEPARRWSVPVTLQALQVLTRASASGDDAPPQPPPSLIFDRALLGLGPPGKPPLLEVSPASGGRRDRPPEAAVPADALDPAPPAALEALAQQDAAPSPRSTLPARRAPPEAQLVGVRVAARGPADGSASQGVPWPKRSPAGASRARRTPVLPVPRPTAAAPPPPPPPPRVDRARRVRPFLVAGLVVALLVAAGAVWWATP